MKYLALLTTLLVVLTIASAIPAAARVDQAAQNAAAEAQNDERTIVQAARQAAGEAASANRAKAENKSGKRHKPKERTEQTAPDKGMPETGGFVTASNMVLLGLGATTAIVVGGVLLRRVLTSLYRTISSSWNTRLRTKPNHRHHKRFAVLRQRR